MSVPITPLADRVIAVREEAKTQTASGIYLPDSSKEKPVAAKVQAVGADVKHVKVGDKIVYKEYSTTEIKIDNVEYLIVKEEDIWNYNKNKKWKNATSLTLAGIVDDILNTDNQEYENYVVQKINNLQGE